LSFLRYWQVAQSEELPEGWWFEIAPAVVQAYGPLFLKSAGWVFAGSCVVTLLATVVATLARRLKRTRGRPTNDMLITGFLPLWLGGLAVFVGLALSNPALALLLLAIVVVAAWLWMWNRKPNS
jgi:hypothetical protein